MYNILPVCNVVKINALSSIWTQSCGQGTRREGVIARVNVASSVYPALCTKGKFAKGGGGAYLRDTTVFNSLYFMEQINFFK